MLGADWVLSGASVGELELNLAVMEAVSAVKFNCEHDEQKLQARVGLEFWNERRLPETRRTSKWPVFPLELKMSAEGAFDEDPVHAGTPDILYKALQTRVPST